MVAEARRPEVNLFDIPELLPGARGSANSAQREEFEQRCREIHNLDSKGLELEEEQDEEEQEEVEEEAQDCASAGPTGLTAGALEEMFPVLDATLIRTLLAEATTPQAVVDMLLALSTSAVEPLAEVEPPAPAASAPLRRLELDDHTKFPCLLDSAGWQVIGRNPDKEELGSAWCENVRAAVDVPAPIQAAVRRPAPASARRKPRDRKSEEQPEEREVPTDYDFRHRAGQLRAQRRHGHRGPRTAEAVDVADVEGEEAASELEGAEPFQC